MTHLLIEYQLDGKRPGYGWVGSIEGFDDHILKNVWRDAIPRGKGWSDFIGARSVKGFSVDPRIMAVSDSIVTDMVDEGGRSGIRKAAIELVPRWRYSEFIANRLSDLPGDSTRSADRKLTLNHWLRIVERLLPKLNRKRSQIVVSHPWQSVAEWRTVEALVYTLASSGMVHTMWGAQVSFTTLALTNRDEGRIVAIPARFADRVRGVPVIDLA